MTRFKILGRVAAQQGDWGAHLPRQQQLLLAVLVMAEGSTVSRKRLEEALWDFREPYPEHGVEKAAYELRKALRRVSREDDPVPGVDGGYRLVVKPEEADVLRFYAHKNAARHKSGPKALEEMQKALQAWGGPGNAGLRGGEVLLDLHGKDLEGQWADNTRHALRKDYRKAVLYYLKQGMNLQQYDLVLCQCEQIDSADPKALRDEDFVTIWISAAGDAGYSSEAHEVYQRAVKAADLAGERPAPSLHTLDAQYKAAVSKPGTVSVMRPAEVALANEVNHEVSAVNEHGQDGDSRAQAAIAQQAVSSELGPRVSSDIEAGEIDADSEVVGIDADYGPGTYVNKMRIEGSVKGKLTGARVRKSN